MQNLRHNPYVGSFTNSSICSINPSSSQSNSTMLLGSRNPNIGTFRHSPAVTTSLQLGLNAILQEDDKKPHISRFHFAHKMPTSERLRISSLILESMPTSRFTNPSETIADCSFPVCVICLDRFEDGDELRTLPCSHCFHSKCISDWLLSEQNGSAANTKNCPTCRHELVLGSPTPTPTPTPVSDIEINESDDDESIEDESNDISSESFLRIGEFLTSSLIQAFSPPDTPSSSHYPAPFCSSDEDVMTSHPTMDDDCIDHARSLLSGSNSNLDDHSLADHSLDDHNLEEVDAHMDSLLSSLLGSIEEPSVDQGDPVCGSFYSDCGFPLSLESKPN